MIIHRRESQSLQRQREAGVAMVEFALVLPLLLTIVFGVMDFGKAMNYWIDQTHLANEGARWAVVNRDISSLPGACAGSLTLQAYLRCSADSSELKDNSAVCVDFLGNPDPQVGDPVQVRMQIEYNWLPWFPNVIPSWSTTTTIRGEATMRLEARPTNYSQAGNIGTCA